MNFERKDRKRRKSMDLETCGLQVLAAPEEGEPGSLRNVVCFAILTNILIGLCGGIAWAFYADFTNRGFRTSSELERSLGMPLIGQLPFVSPSEAALDCTAASLDSHAFLLLQ